MHLVVRTYSGPNTTAIFDVIDARQDSIRELLEGVPGFVSYVAGRTADGGAVTVTVCEDEVGTEESSRRAAEWIEENWQGMADPSDTPAITEATMFMRL